MNIIVQHAASYSTWLLVAASAFFSCSVVHVLRARSSRRAGAPSPSTVLPQQPQDVRTQNGVLGNTADLEVRYLRRLADEAPEPVVFDLDKLVGTTVAARRAGGMRLDVFHADEQVEGVPADLAVALDSLLVNAHVHGEGRGVRVESTRDGDFVEVTVRDLGPGVPTFVRPLLFEAGVRASEEPGNGLGLHLSRTLLRENGGDLLLRETEAGAAFVARIPAQRRAQLV